MKLIKFAKNPKELGNLAGKKARNLIRASNPKSRLCNIILATGTS